MLAARVILLFVLKMALVPACTEGSFLELGMDGSIESLGRLVESQRKLFYNQVDHLHRVVVTQCKLTGINPLSQEMAAGALSIKIGKKPRDLLNPKAVKYMQSIFSIKDVIGKKEARDISALCGVTATQVKEFFSGQRSKVRKLVRLAKQKTVRLDASEAASMGYSVNPDATPFCRNDALLGAISIDNVGVPAQVPSSDGNSPATQCDERVHVSAVDAKLVQVISSPPSQEETLPGIDEDDKKFLENIFNLMRKEGTFSGQVKLMEWILQIHNSALLAWFSTKGSITLLATWLSQAAIEDQTTVLIVILKVLCHLPLHKALPVEVCSLLPSVNKLRFYRKPDVSNRAKIVLSKWSNFLRRYQSRKYPFPLNSKNGIQKEIIRKQRINEILSDNFWRSKIGNVDDIRALTENNGNDSKPSFGHASKLLTASGDSPNRKQQRQSAIIKIKERRIVRLVEQPDEKAAARSAQVGRAATLNHSRPMSTDDIQKAKMRAMFMQDKYGKPDLASAENPKIEPNRELPVPTTMQQEEEVKREEEKEVGVLPCGSETAAETKAAEAPQAEPLERMKAVRVQWVAPLEMKIDRSWRVGEADGSKELAVQGQRILREKETFYPSLSDIPPNPKEPWDVEMDFDDSLTPEIPSEQQPDTDAVEASAARPVDGQASPENSAVRAAPALPFASSCNAAAPVAVPALPFASSCNAAARVAATALPIASSRSGTEPDLELLAVLLKNPELVFALTSGHGRNLSNNERVALLDMIKHSNVVLSGAANGMSGANLDMPNDSIPTSLPSPTPPSDAERVASWRSAFPAAAKATFLQPQPQPQPNFAVLHSFPTQIYGPAGSFTSQRPNPSAPQHFLPSSYALQQSPIVESLPSQAYAVSSSAVAGPPPTLQSFRQDSHNLNPAALPALSSHPSFPPAHNNPQMLMISEPSAAVLSSPDPNPWARRDMDMEWCDEMPESSALRPNAAETPWQIPRFGDGENSHRDPYPRHRPTPAGREEVAGRSWSPGSPPARSSELRDGRGRSYAGSRGEQGWSRKQGWARQRHGHRDQYRSSGGKWRDRDRDRDRDRR